MGSMIDETSSRFCLSLISSKRLFDTAHCDISSKRNQMELKISKRSVIVARVFYVTLFQLT